MADPLTSELVRTAHADAWQAIGRLREPVGGGAVELPGVRLMASGLPGPPTNSGDVDDAQLVDLAAVARWYGERGVSWGLRLPAGAGWPHGRLLLRRGLMAVRAGELVGGDVPPGVTVRAATTDDLDAVVMVDAAAFGSETDVERPWIAPFIDAAASVVAVAELGGEPVGTGYAVLADGRAGPTVYLGGVGVVPDARRRGIGSALSAWLARRGFARGARLAHLSPDDDVAASVYAGLGFVEVDGIDIYVDIEP